MAFHVIHGQSIKAEAAPAQGVRSQVGDPFYNDHVPQCKVIFKNKLDERVLREVP